MTVKVKFRKVQLTPYTIQTRQSLPKIEGVTIKDGGNEVTIDFEGDTQPTPGQLQALLQFIRQGRWELAEE